MLMFYLPIIIFEAMLPSPKRADLLKMKRTEVSKTPVPFVVGTAPACNE